MNGHSSPPKWLSERDVAAMTGISLSTLRKHRHFMMGIPYSKVGRSVRYEEAEVVAFMRSKRIEPQKAPRPAQSPYGDV